MVLARRGLEFKAQRLNAGWRHRGTAIMNEASSGQPGKRAGNCKEGSGQPGVTAVAVPGGRGHGRSVHGTLALFMGQRQVFFRALGFTNGHWFVLCSAAGCKRATSSSVRAASERNGTPPGNPVSGSGASHGLSTSS